MNDSPYNPPESSVESISEESAGAKQKPMTIKLMLTIYCLGIALAVLWLANILPARELSVSVAACLLLVLFPAIIAVSVTKAWNISRVMLMLELLLWLPLCYFSFLIMKDIVGIVTMSAYFISKIICLSLVLCTKSTEWFRDKNNYSF